MLLSANTDPMGRAIADYHREGKAHDLVVRSSLFDDDVLPVPHLFRSPLQMPPLEQKALQRCRGRVLDVGAGAGSHALALQALGLDVTAIDISPLSVEVMRERGVQNALCADFFVDPLEGSFDTLLLMMNGIGICGGLNELPHFFARVDALLAPGGQVLTDSCDLAHIFADDDGHFATQDMEEYYGEVDYQMKYGSVLGPPFNWLYIDFDTLQAQAAEHGFQASLLEKGEMNTFLAAIKRSSEA